MVDAMRDMVTRPVVVTGLVIIFSLVLCSLVPSLTVVVLRSVVKMGVGGGDGGMVMNEGVVSGSDSVVERVARDLGATISSVVAGSGSRGNSVVTWAGTGVVGEVVVGGWVVGCSVVGDAGRIADVAMISERVVVD